MICVSPAVTRFAVVNQTITVTEGDEDVSIEVCLQLLSPPTSLLRTEISIEATGMHIILLHGNELFLCQKILACDLWTSEEPQVLVGGDLTSTQPESTT